MATFTDFETARSASAYGNQFSAQDLAIAQSNPDLGMALLQNKEAWNAPGATIEQKALANQANEGIRSQFGNLTSFGNYTGGTDGSLYNPLPTSISASPSSSYTSPYQTGISNMLGKMENYGAFDYGPAPVYNSQYTAQIADLLGQIQNRQAFSYDKNTDPNWSAYAKQYRREGDRATRDVLAAQAALSGGLTSSAAMTAATQAGDYYAGQLADKLPELYQQAYGRYTDDYQMKRQALADTHTQEQSDYSKYLTDLGQYNTDRNFSYTDYLNQYDMLGNTLGAYQSADNSAFSQYSNQRDHVAQQAQQAIANAFNNMQYGDAQKQQSWSNAFAEQQYADSQKQLSFENEIAMQQLQMALARANGSGGGSGGGTKNSAAEYLIDPGMVNYQYPNIGGMNAGLAGTNLAAAQDIDVQSAKEAAAILGIETISPAQVIQMIEDGILTGSVDPKTSKIVVSVR